MPNLGLSREKGECAVPVLTDFARMVELLSYDVSYYISLPV
ncbi:MAG TPA: hypothetical protein VNO30_43700 [Kofleriaceae bacterium]|nr:hypothetical protein [Kofleriaceae bacterium]